jgi:hypothetical protein
MGMIDKMGKEVIPIKYQNLYDFYDGLAAAMMNDKWDLLIKMTNKLCPPDISLFLFHSWED